MYELSVVICSHNPRAEFLSRTLRSLRQQDLDSEDWEILLVDNASKEPLAETYDISWHPHARHIVEKELGLSAARQRGMNEAASELLVFLDDDTPLDRAYLRRVLDIKKEWPWLGVWGSGSVTAEYEVPPAEDLRDFVPLFGVRQAERPLWSNVSSCWQATPWGAGSCVRAPVAEMYLHAHAARGLLISGRRGKGGLLSGEDCEVAYVACDMGFGMAVFPELRLTHLIPKERVGRHYLLRLYEGTELSNALLNFKWRGIVPVSPLRPWGLLSIMKNSIIKRGLERQRYFATVRAIISARRMITSNVSEKLDGQVGKEKRASAPNIR